MGSRLGGTRCITMWLAMGACKALGDPSVPPDPRCRIRAAIDGAITAVKECTDVGAKSNRPSWFSEGTKLHLGIAAKCNRAYIAAKKSLLLARLLLCFLFGSMMVIVMLLLLRGSILRSAVCVRPLPLGITTLCVPSHANALIRIAGSGSGMSGGRCVRHAPAVTGRELLRS